MIVIGVKREVEKHEHKNLFCGFSWLQFNYIPFECLIRQINQPQLNNNKNFYNAFWFIEH